MSNALLNDIMPYWSDEIKRHKVTLNKMNHTYVKNIYDAIYEAKKSYKNKDFEINIKVDKFDKKSLLTHSLYHSSYFPFEMKKNIVEDVKYATVVTMKLNDIKDKPEIKLTFYSNYKIQLQKLNSYVEYVYTILHICYSQRTHKCGKNLDIRVILSKYKKTIPTNNVTPLGPYHVNSAITTECKPNGEILIFREEEWTKTLIHELFHALGLDFSSYFLSSNKSILNKLFHVDSTYNIYETYSEIMALILHVCMISFKLSNENSKISRENGEIKSTYIFYIEMLLTYELYFSNFQQMKILNLMNIERYMFKRANTHKKYVSHLKTAYIEKSNVFCYYILKSALLNNINSFLVWLQLNNQTSLQFNNTQKTIENFMFFLDRSFYDDSNDITKNVDVLHRNFIDSKREEKKYNVLFNTMRMTINDYF